MKNTRPIAAESRLIAVCGLYCGACRKQLQDRALQIVSMLWNGRSSPKEKYIRQI